MSDLHRLIYVSTAVDGSDVDLWALSSMLQSAERNNLAHGISGLLLAHNGAFCQVLEGPRAALDGLMAILANDRRHTDIRIVCDDPIEERRFSFWSMAQVVVTPALSHELSGVDMRTLGCAGALDILRRAASRMTDAA